MVTPTPQNTTVDQKLMALDNKKDIIKKILMYIKSSRMSMEEKKMRLAMIPYMEEKHLIKLADILEREVNEYTEVYMSLLNSAVTKPEDATQIEKNNE
ncbi:MAG: hypothetical protein NTX91_04635 [candidate division SR1 bacterium]|nr:hypothetical protein [candidate division SR1 bacterium]